MIKQKKCAECGTLFTLYKSTDKYCCYACAKANQKPPKKRKKIRFMSAKMEADYVVYRPIRDKYMSENPVCEVEGCCKPANDLHHKAGREGYADEWARNEGIKLLWDVRYFMAICRLDHIKCDEDPNWAKENGYVVKIN